MKMNTLTEDETRDNAPTELSEDELGEVSGGLVDPFDRIKSLLGKVSIEDSEGFGRLARQCRSCFLF